MKNEIRSVYKLKRLELAHNEAHNKSIAAEKVFLNSDIYKNCSELMIYMPIKNEVDTSEIIKAAFSEGKRVIFPVTDGKTGVITPCYAQKDTKFTPGAFSVPEPSGSIHADVDAIDVILVPGIAFDRKGARLGFGKGCYDRLLKNTNAIKVGFCYDFQICSDIPEDESDIPMDYIVSESGMIKC